MTLNGHYVLWFKIHASFGDQHKNLNEDETRIITSTDTATTAKTLQHSLIIAAFHSLCDNTAFLL